MNTDSHYSKFDRSSIDEPMMVAVIDIGATSLRMQISEIHNDQIRKIESFSQAVSIGRDSFSKGSIDRSTIEDCVAVLEVYRLKLNEYQITDPNNIRVIATSGVKEARNRLAFQDRIFIATGFEIEPFDQAELHRVTYLGVLPFLTDHPKVFSGKTVVCEVGGGTTELLCLDGKDVTFAHSFRLGALRLRRKLHDLDVSAEKRQELMETLIVQMLDRNTDEKAFEGGVDCYVAMGGDVRFAVREILESKQPEDLVELDLKQLKQFTDEVLSMTPDRIVKRFHFSLPDALTLGPGLLTHLQIAEYSKARKFYVVEANLRDSLVEEMALGRVWSESLQSQIVASAILIAEKFDVDLEHSCFVAFLSCKLFDDLRDLHQLPTRYRGLLEIAAILHEVGLYVSSRSYHKHSMYLIRNSEFFGIGAREVDLVSLVARYHRRANPQPSHELYTELGRHDRVVVAKLAAILRVAKALDASRSQKYEILDCKMEAGRVVIRSAPSKDISLEVLDMKRNSASLFRDIYGSNIVLTSAAVE